MKPNLSVGEAPPRVNPWLSLNSFHCLQLEESFIRSSTGIVSLLVCQIADPIKSGDPNNDKPEDLPTREGSTRQGPASSVKIYLVGSFAEAHPKFQSSRGSIPSTDLIQDHGRIEMIEHLSHIVSLRGRNI